MTGSAPPPPGCDPRPVAIRGDGHDGDRSRLTGPRGDGAVRVLVPLRRLRSSAHT
jgi:hypothetical protein